VQDDHFPREIVELDDNSDVMIKIEPETWRWSSFIRW
jgi:hypothetical protein